MYGGMADAIDLRSIFRKGVGVQVPLHLPIMKDFKVCPRCQGEWEYCGIEYNKCVDCKSKYSFRSLTFYIQDFLLWNDVLYFFEDKCVYQTFDDSLGGIELHLLLL